MEIGKKLKDARMKSGFTQETVAEKINVSRQTISNWENEKSYPDIISVIELSSIYSISLDDLLKGDERMEEENKISVYIKKDANGNVTDINSDIFIEDTENWTKIDEGTGDKYAHAQGNYFSESLTTENGIYRYKYIDNEVVEKTAEEIENETEKSKNETENNMSNRRKVKCMGCEYGNYFGNEKYF